ncbi:MAG: RING finger protein [Angelakisella sp.]
MPNYTGNSCPACGKVFGEGDDIVVCPICGSPHHRECYKMTGHCGNEDFHGEGKKWEGIPSEDSGEPTDLLVCGQCGKPNPTGSIFCQNCGHRIGAEPENGGAGMPSFADFMQQQAHIDYTDKLDDEVTVKEACDYIGPNNIAFLMKFKALRARGGMSFNWSAFFFGYFYCFYRKMYKLGAILLGVFVLSIIPTGYFSAIAVGDILAATGTISFPIEFIVGGRGYQGLMLVTGITRVISLGASLYCGLFFNKLYFAEMVKKIKRVRETGHFSTGSQEYSYALYSAGGVNMVAVMILISAIIFAYIAYGYVASFMLVGR